MRKLIGYALGSGCSVWTSNKGDRYVKAFFLYPDQCQKFEDLATNNGFAAFSGKCFYSVAGCHHFTIGYF